MSIDNNNDWRIYTYNRQNKPVNVEFNEGDSWKSVPEKYNVQGFESIFNKVDTNKDGIIQQNEKDTLKKLFIANMESRGNKENPANNNTFDITQSDLENLKNLSDEDIQKIANLDENADYKYTIINGKSTKTTAGTASQAPKLIKSYKKFKPVQNPVDNWSEGLDRHIDTITVSSENGKAGDIELERQAPEFIATMEQAGKENGFDVRQVFGTENGRWFEDYAIRRADGKILVASPDSIKNLKAHYRSASPDESITKLSEKRANINNGSEGGAIQFTPKMTEHLPDDGSVVPAKSYLEGGNVLNTCKADGTPGAVIGEESIGYTMLAMGLKPSKKNIGIAKKQIAQDLGLKPEDVTFMPQFDFHIDMAYRPLNNGQMAVPDYEEGIKILQNTQIAGMDEETKNALIANMQTMSQKTAEIRTQAEQSLKDGGYEIVHIPYFAPTNTDESTININYMNGVGGTGKNGQKFYITNDSGYPEINEAVQKYFEKVGVDKMYFAPTSEFFKGNGGVDCLTQEQPE